ncbi:unnamed protein product [Meloidogyne enterolobii]|uniref:Uncharacterized protein n=1 Tax=Meloidogyne enterolobii TaxID=390850 RepID=A0ACB0Y4U4_MELEN
MPKPSQGYGGKFGVETDRIDKCAACFDYKGKVEPHPSQKDYSLGFGGTFGVEADPVDKFALGWDSREQLQQHESQKGFFDFHFSVIFNFVPPSFLLTQIMKKWSDFSFFLNYTLLPHGIQSVKKD